MGDVFFKGLRGQLYLHIDDGVEHGEILRQLRRKLNASVSFFTPGTKVLLECASGECCRERVDDISRLLADYGLVLLTEGETEEQDRPEERQPSHRSIPAGPVGVVKIRPAVNWLRGEQHYREGRILTVTHILRSGQRVVYDGSIAVFGDVNPGAEVIAGGNITVLGVCRGLLHAGAFGDAGARIYAAVLRSSQVRIAGRVALAPPGVESEGVTGVMFELDDQQQVTARMVGKNAGR